MGKLNVANRTLFTYDNLPVMQGINSETIDLIYLDPPFNSKRNYAAPIGSQAAGAAFRDTWNLDDIKREWVEEIEADNKATWASIISAGHISGESTQAYLTYMAIRLIEMRRILKDTGSIYLHCDPTASHYLKLVLDAVFGQKNFRNEIVWSYHRWTGATKHFQRMHDVIFVFGKSENSVFNQLFEPHSIKGIKRHKGQNRTTVFDSDRKLQQTYVDKSGLKAMRDVWEISYLNANAKERTGYPTQKPLALLDRIIKASSNENDMVLDPFCGCATTCIAAEKLGRQWIGIDIEPEARNLVIQRLEKEIDVEALFKAGGGTLPDVIHRKTPPKRTEKDAPRRSRNIKLKLYKLQEGRCAAPCGEGGQGRAFPIDIFEIDHIRPTSKGGANIDENLQLLCGPCNRRKTNRTMQYLLDLLSQESMNF